MLLYQTVINNLYSYFSRSFRILENIYNSIFNTAYVKRKESFINVVWKLILFITNILLLNKLEKI